MFFIIRHSCSVFQNGRAILGSLATANKSAVFQTALVALLCLSACGLRESNYRIQSAYSAMLRADLRHLPYPVPSTVFSEWRIDEAYATQALFVKAKFRNDSIGGFKAGLTAKPAWEKFGLDEPLLGVLPASGQISAGTAISAATFRDLKIETELAFIVGQHIAKPVADVAALRGLIAAIAPAIELPDLSFRQVGSLNGKDVIAANATAAGYMLGATASVATADLAALVVTLTRDGQALGHGKGSDALGDPWQAALWLVNKVIQLGYSIEPGQVLLSGALPAPYPGQQGYYTADFGDLGKIEFEVQ